MSITPSQNRCERKLNEIQRLKQKDHHSDEDIEKINNESYYKNIMNQVYKQKVATDHMPVAEAQPVFAQAHCVGDLPTSIGNNTVMVRCNHNKNVYKYIVTGKKYIIEMPKIKTVLNVTCTFAACRAADMLIDTAVVDGCRDHSSETCTISYNYDNFDRIYYTSFSYADDCIIYCG